MIVGCVNSPRQMVAVEYMKMRGFPKYAINFDGPLFESGSWVKRVACNRYLCGAAAYLVAGSRSVGSVRRAVRGGKIVSYPFSSLTKSDVAAMGRLEGGRDQGLVLCVGQYERYKGLDILVEVAAQFPCLRFRFIGAGRRASELEEIIRSFGLYNVEVIPFLRPCDLAREFACARLLVLPSRQECWGLVVNEAAACGTPIVSTWGSGAAVEFLSGDYPWLLAEPDRADSLAGCICKALGMSDAETEHYSAFLRNKALDYVIEDMVECHIALF